MRITLWQRKKRTTAALAGQSEKRTGEIKPLSHLSSSGKVQSAHGTART